MIKKLRRHFIILAMVSVFITLFLLMAAINIINYREVVKNADNILYLLKSNEGEFPDDAEKKLGNDRSDYSKETPFESRYFSVDFYADGDMGYINTHNIEAIDYISAAKYALHVYKSDKISGFYNNFRYLKYKNEDGSTTILFLDCLRGLQNFRSFLYASILFSLIALIIVFILVHVVSGRIIQPVAESYEKQKRFITDAGHEIKTPLATINADAAVLEMEGLENNEWLNDIKMQTHRLTALTTDLITLSRMEETDINTKKTEFSISDVTLKLAQSFEARAKMEHKNYQMDIEPKLEYKGDERAIGQLVSILLDNAFKYANENGNISISLRKDPKNIELVVYNTCESIHKEDLPHLFDRFYRTDSSRNSQTGGYGIGLSIAYAVVQNHKGKIKAETDNEKSLTMTVELK